MIHDRLSSRKNLTPPASRAGGFTLIELSIVLIIIGILLIPLAQMYNLYIQEKYRITTKENIEASVRAMAVFSPTRFPCPSNRALPPGNVNYGYEQCTGVPACTAAYQGICRSNGSRDTAIDADASADPILIGGVPFRTRVGTTTILLPRINSSTTLDGWNRQLTYAVSERLTDVAKTGSLDDFKYGVIAAIDEHGNPTAGISAAGDAQLVILSHGPTGQGGFTPAGVAIPCSTTAKDAENCDNDFTFVEGLGAYDANDANFYDDTVYFYQERGGSLWTNLNDTLGNPTPHLINLNQLNVGINTTAPATKLDVAGTIRADTIRTQTYCDKGNANCFDTDYLGSTKTSGATTNTCPTGYVMTGIDSLRAECTRPTLNLPPGYTGVTCAGSGTFIRSILSNGCVICTDGVKVCG